MKLAPTGNYFYVKTIYDPGEIFLYAISKLNSFGLAPSPSLKYKLIGAKFELILNYQVSFPLYPSLLKYIHWVP